MTSVSGYGGRLSAIMLALALALLATIALASRAQAAETIYWDNYGDSTIGFANIDGTGGGSLGLGDQELVDPEGMAYDTVTNRLFAASDNDKIIAVNLDGSGAASFTAPDAEIAEVEGIALDPVARLIFWLNTDTEKISWAKLDGSAGGTLNTDGATVDGPCCRLAVDPTARRVFWVNQDANPNVLSYASYDNTGGGDLSTSGSSVEPSIEGLAADPVGGRIYYLVGDEIGFANLNGSGGGDVSTAAGSFDGPWGLAFDPSLGRLYWGNENNSDGQGENAIGFLDLAGSGGGINIATSHVNNPQDPVIIKSPTGTGVPTLARDAKAPATLTCAPGTWGADYAGSFVYQAPRSTGLQWTLNGAAISGATAAAFTATQPGSYACVETATNQAGSAVQTSAPATVKAAKLKLSTKKKGKAEAGGLVKFKVKAVNQGDLAAKKSAKLCVKLPKAAKDDLKAPKCKKANLKGGAKKTFTIKVKVKPGADEGTDKLTFKVKGVPGKAAKSKIVVK